MTAKKAASRKPAARKPAPQATGARPMPRTASLSRPDVLGSPKHRPHSEVPGARPASARSTQQPVDVSQPKGGIKVQATATGYYDNARRRPGDIFTIRTEKEFSKRWMVKANPRAAERTTTGKQALQQHHDDENRARLGIEADIDNPDDGSIGVLGDD